MSYEEEHNMKNLKEPLKLDNGAEIHTLRDLKNNWNLENIIKLWESGELQKWLKERYYEYELEEVNSLNKGDSNFKNILSEIFDIECDEDITSDENLARDKKIRLLSDFVDEEILKQVDIIALDQRDLKRILANGTAKVFLFNNTFEIPVNKMDVEYVILGDSKISNQEEAINMWKLGYIKISGFEDYSLLIDEIKKLQLDYKSNVLNGDMEFYRFAYYPCINGRNVYLKESTHLSENEAYNDAYNQITACYNAWENYYFNENDNEYKNKIKGSIEYYKKLISKTEENMRTSLMKFKTQLKDCIRKIKDEQLKETLFNMVDNVTFYGKNYENQIEEITRRVLTDGKAKFLKYDLNYYINKIIVERHEGVLSLTDGKVKTRYRLNDPSVFKEMSSFTDGLVENMGTQLLGIVKKEVLDNLYSLCNSDITQLKEKIIENMQKNQPIKIK